jgi:aminopeptidase YwaD
MIKGLLYEEIMKDIQIENMEKLLNSFSNLHRLTGTVDCSIAADYIVEQLKLQGIDYELHEFEGYFSNPVKSELTINIGGSIQSISSKPRSFSLNCPDGITGELIYDNKSKNVCLGRVEEQELYSTFRGKIVLSWNFYEDYAKKIESYGAAGVIHIWPTEEKVIHEETVGPIWGTPT